MAIDKNLIHFKKFATFNSKKLSANAANTQYTLGVNGTVTTGVPDIPYQALVWIKDTQQHWTHGQLYGSSDYYGVEWDTAVADTACTRIGNMALHRTLPIQSRMRGCLLNDNGDVLEYLDANNWTSATRDGSKGQVMVELPAHYRKFETEGTIRRVKISEYPLPGYHLVPKQYVSAYEATVQRSTTKLCSVANSDADYRGGANTSRYDGTYRSLLGRPATSISRTNFRAYARKRNTATTEWNCMTYDIQKELYWLFVVEYATLNSQAAYNAAKDANGYMQGGLGDGVTTWDGTSWNNFNGYNPFIPCGHTDSLGNASGIVAYTVKDSANADLKTFNVPRYRGVENPFGHIWQWTDGVNVRISPTTANGGDDLSKVFVCSDPALFTDSNYNGYSHVGNEARAEGYAKTHIFGEYGEIIPDAVGGGSTTYMCDYHYTNIPTTETLRGVLFGGATDVRAEAGFGCAYSLYVPSSENASVGSRLCFIPADTYDYDDLINKPYIDGNVRLLIGSSAGQITTAQFIAKLTELGLFTQRFGVVRGSFEYAYNDTIIDTGTDVISLYGAVVEVFGTTKQYTIRVTTTSMVHSSNHGVARHQYMYFYNGDNYSPGWTKVVNLTDLANFLTLDGGKLNDSLSAPKFIGPLEGNATTATTAASANSVAWANVSEKPYVNGNVRIMTGSSSADITTAQFVEKLTSMGLFTQKAGVIRGSFEYGYNDRITDTGIDILPLYGAVVEVFGVAGQYTIRVTTTSSVLHNGVPKHQYIYFYNGDNYNPGWVKLVNTTDLADYLPKTGGVVNGDVDINGYISAKNFVSDTTTPIIYVATTSQALAPNRMYVWQKAQSKLNLTLTAPTNVDILNKYMAQFPVYNNTVVTLPANISWAGGAAPTFKNGNVYQLSIINNKAVCSEFVGIYTEPKWSLSGGFSNEGADEYNNTLYTTQKSDEGVATITIEGYDSFTLLVRHVNGWNADIAKDEGEYDYMVVGDLDKTITASSVVGSAGVKITTQGKDTPDADNIDLFNTNYYTQVWFNNIGGGKHTIMVAYHKDGQYDIGDDIGCILIPKQ